MRLAPLALAAALLLPAEARAEDPRPEPPSGTWMLVLGSLSLAGGVGDLATAPLCRLPAIRSSAQPACIGTSVGVGLGLVGAGIPLVVLGAHRREAWRTWRASVGVGSISMAWTW